MGDVTGQVAGQAGEIKGLTVQLLRECFRHLNAWRILYETDGIDTLCNTSGVCLNLFDVEYLYEQVPRLPPRQAQAIEYCLLRGFYERDVAVAMGVSPTNPVMSYATAGLTKIIQWAREGHLPRFGPDPLWGREVA